MAKDRFARLPEEKRLRILDAAIWEFAERGYHGTSMRQIAQRAGIAKGLTYYYFDGKEDLFLYVVQHAGDTWVRDFERFSGGRPPEDTREYYRHVVRFMMEFIDSRPRMYQLYVRNAHERGLPFLPQILAQSRRLDKLLLDRLRADQRAARVRPGVDVEKARYILDGVADRLYEFFFSPRLDVLAVHDASREERLRVAEELFDVVWAGLVKDDETGRGPSPAWRESSSGDGPRR